MEVVAEAEAGFDGPFTSRISFWLPLCRRLQRLHHPMKEKKKHFCIISEGSLINVKCHKLTEEEEKCCGNALLVTVFLRLNPEEGKESVVTDELTEKTLTHFHIAPGNAL